MPNIDALKLIPTVNRLNATRVVSAYICISELLIDRLKETELAPIVHFHCVLARTVHHVFSSATVRAISFRPIVT